MAYYLLQSNMDGQVVSGGAENDTYILSSNTLDGGETIDIQDAQGDNSLQLVAGLEIASSTVANDSAQLELSNGTILNITGATTFGYDPGGNVTAGIDNPDSDYSTFATETLGAPNVPDQGADPVSGDDNVNISGGGEEGPTFSISAEPNPVDEGDTTANTVTLTITRTGDTSVTADVDVNSSNGTAQAGSDYVAVSQTVSFAAGDETQEITTETIPDEVREPDEDFTVALSNPTEGSVSSDEGSVDITIANDDPNELPEITAPAEANAIIGATSQVDGISFTDEDDNTGFTVTLSADGTSQLAIENNLHGATAKDGDGNTLAKDETANTIVLSGTETNVNGALSNLAYVTNATTPGIESLSIEVEDVFGGTDSETVEIEIGEQGTFTTATTDDLEGSTGNDIFVADQTTNQVLQSGDQADGLAGTDTLRVTSNVGKGNINALDANAISRVQKVDIETEESVNADTETIDMADFSQDVTWVQFTTNNATAAADNTDTLTAANVDSGTEFEFTNDAGVFTVSSINNSGNSDAITVTLTGGVTLPDIDDTAGEIDTVNINSNGDNANEVTNLEGDNTLAGGADINIGGSADFTIALGTGDLDTVDGSNAEGALTIDGSSVTTGNDKLTIKGGSGKDLLTATSNENTTLRGNGGDDTLVGNTQDDTIDGGAGADTLTGNGGNDTFVFAPGDTGSISDTRDEITDLGEGDKLNVTAYGDFGLTDGEDLATSATDDTQEEIYIDQANDRIVMETTADGSTVEEVDISNIAAESPFTYNDGGDNTVGTDDDYIQVGAAPLTANNDEVGTLDISGKAIGTPTVEVKQSGAPTLNDNNVGTNSVRTVDITEVTNNGVTINTSGPLTESLTVDGSDQGDTITGGDGADTLDGDGGTDTVSYSDITSAPQTSVTGVAINISSGSVTTSQQSDGSSTNLAAGKAAYIGGSAGAVIDDLTSFENITGSGLADEIWGDSTANVITGGDGEDVIDVGAGGSNDHVVYTATDEGGSTGDDVSGLIFSGNEDDIDINGSLETAVDSDGNTSFETKSSTGASGNVVTAADTDMLFTTTGNSALASADAEDTDAIATALNSMFDFTTSPNGSVLGTINLTGADEVGLYVYTEAGGSTGDDAVDPGEVDILGVLSADGDIASADVNIA